MATQPLDHYTLEHYLEIQDTLDYRSEYNDGTVLPVEDATPTHARLGFRVGSVLERRLPACTVYDSSLNVYISASNRIVHPDTTVLCGPPGYTKPNSIDNPTIVVEVTSPSTKDYDHGTKREQYFTLPSLEHYLLVSQTERAVGHYQRSGAAWIYTDHRSEATISLGSTQIPLAEIYEGILP